MKETDEVAVGNLRAFVTVLVVVHHALLAYHPYAPPPPWSMSMHGVPQIWRAFPVVDKAHWNPATFIVGFNDTYFMSLMFLLSGLFVWGALRKKGAAVFLRDRALRLGVPFVVAVGVLAPLAYLPTYLQSHTHDGFWKEWLAAGSWPSGPAWFLWVLLAFDVLAAGAWLVLGGRRQPRWLAGIARRPLLAFLVVVALSAAAYLPMAHVFSPERWSTFGPFVFQTARLVHYGVYFAVGIALGAVGIGDTMLAARSALARWWPLWVVAAAGVFYAAVKLVDRIYATGDMSLMLPINLAFVIGCAASSFALTALFVRFAQRATRATDSLRANAYGIYIVHYAIVSWLQLALTGATLPGVVKAWSVIVGALVIAWSASAAVRRLPGVARIV